MSSFWTRPIGGEDAPFRWREPWFCRPRLKRDLAIRLVTVVAVWVAGTGVMLAAFAGNAHHPGFGLAVFLGAVIGLGPATLLLLLRRDVVSGDVVVSEKGIRRRWSYAWLTHVRYEMRHWPYGAIHRCALIPSSGIEGAFAVMVLTDSQGQDILVIPSRIHLQELAQFLESKGVKVEYEHAVPAALRRGFDWRVAIVAGIVGVLCFAAGALFYAAKMG